MKTVVVVAWLAAWGVLFVAWVAWGLTSIRPNKTRKIVHRNLDSALQGGHFDRDGCLFNMSEHEIAYDMTLYAEDCENFRPEDLVPYVREWLDLYEAVRIREH